MTEIRELTAEQIAAEVSRGQLRAADVVEDYLGRADRVEPTIRAFLRRHQERARRQAEQIDRRVMRGEKLGTLAGVPVAVKDNISIEGLELTCGSRILDGYVAPYSATATQRLVDSDAVLVGQANMDEFAMGSSCENSAFFPTRNPWRFDRVPGGSSGGPAAAVASGSASLALGSDTGGSIRQPAAFCGLVGLKPSYGRVSRYGLVAFASSLDQIGPLTPSVRDAALALGILAGHDSRDSTSADRPPENYLAEIEDGIAGLRIGVVKEVDADQLTPDVANVWAQTLSVLESAGAVVVEVSVPSVRAAIAIYYVVANCEASANLARFDGVRYGFRELTATSLRQLYIQSRGHGFGAEVKRRIVLGTFALSTGYYDAYYGRALGVLGGMRRELTSVFERVDLIATPTSPTGAFEIGEWVDDPLSMYLSDIYTTPASLVGLPGLALPCGFDDSGLPLSLQLVARPFEEALLLRAGRSFEKALGPQPRAPIFWGEVAEDGAA